MTQWPIYPEIAISVILCVDTIITKFNYQHFGFGVFCAVFLFFWKNALALVVNILRKTSKSTILIVTFYQHRKLYYNNSVCKKKKELQEFVPQSHVRKIIFCFCNNNCFTSFDYMCQLACQESKENFDDRNTCWLIIGCVSVILFLRKNAISSKPQSKLNALHFPL